MRAIDQQAETKGLLNERRTVHSEIDANHEPFATDLADETKLPGQVFKTGAQLDTAGANVGEQIVFLNDGQEFECCGTDQRTSAESGSVHARTERGCEFLAGDEGAQRETAGQRLSNRHHVRQGGKFPVSEFSTGATKARLDFIGNQRGMMIFGQATSPLPKLFAYRADTTFALNRFYDDGTDSFIEFQIQIGDIVRPYEINARNQRFERFTIFGCVRDGKGAHGAAMKGIFESKNARLRWGQRPAGARLRVRPRELQSTFDRFASAIREKDAIETRPPCQFVGERCLIGVVEQV